MPEASRRNRVKVLVAMVILTRGGRPVGQCKLIGSSAGLAYLRTTKRSHHCGGGERGELGVA